MVALAAALEVEGEVAAAPALVAVAVAEVELGLCIACTAMICMLRINAVTTSKSCDFAIRKRRALNGLLARGRATEGCCCCLAFFPLLLFFAAAAADNDVVAIYAAAGSNAARVTCVPACLPRAASNISTNAPSIRFKSLTPRWAARTAATSA